MSRGFDLVVVNDNYSIDHVVYWTLKTYFHPLFTWFFNLALYSATSHNRYIYVALTVTLCHYLSKLNDDYKISPKLLPSRKSVLITGGSKGLGFLVVKNMLEILKVDNIVIIDVIPPVEELGNKVKFYQCDISDFELLDRVLEEVLLLYHCNVLINNAGIRHDKSLNDLSFDEINSIFQVNAFAPIRILKKWTPVMGKLHVVTISSVLGIVGPKNLSIYSASKAALIQIHEALSYEMREHTDMRFTLFLPGQLTTDMFKTVNTSHTFLAPIVDANLLSLKIVEVIKDGARGTYCYPFYTNFMSIMRLLPFGIYEYLRNYSEMDLQIVPAGK